MRRGKWLHRKGKGNGPGLRGALLIWRCLGGTGEAMAAFRVAAGRVGGVAALARGGLVDAVGAVVGAHGLAQPAVAGTERLFRQPAGAISLFTGRWGEGGGRVCGVEQPVADGAGGAALCQGVSDAPPQVKRSDAAHCSGVGGADQRDADCAVGLDQCQWLAPQAMVV